MKWELQIGSSIMPLKPVAKFSTFLSAISAARQMSVNDSFKNYARIVTPDRQVFDFANGKAVPDLDCDVG